MTSANRAAKIVKPQCLPRGVDLLCVLEPCLAAAGAHTPLSRMLVLFASRTALLINRMAFAEVLAASFRGGLLLPTAAASDAAMPPVLLFRGLLGTVDDAGDAATTSAKARFPMGALGESTGETRASSFENRED